MSARPVLYVEDEEDDVFFMRRAFQQAGLSVPLVVLHDGQSTLQHFEAALAAGVDESVPQLVILDLNLPRKSGLEVLQWLRAQPGLNTVPVVIFSSSTQPADIERAYLHGANAYLVKPGTPGGLSVLVNAIHDFWLKHNRPAINPG